MERNEYILLHEFHRLKYICPDRSWGKRAAAAEKVDAQDDDGDSLWTSTLCIQVSSKNIDFTTIPTIEEEDKVSGVSCHSNQPNCSWIARRRESSVIGSSTRCSTPAYCNSRNPTSTSKVTYER